MESVVSQRRRTFLKQLMIIYKECQFYISCHFKMAMTEVTYVNRQFFHSISVINSHSVELLFNISSKTVIIFEMKSMMSFQKNVLKPQLCRPSVISTRNWKAEPIKNQTTSHRFFCRNLNNGYLEEVYFGDFIDIFKRHILLTYIILTYFIDIFQRRTYNNLI